MTPIAVHIGPTLVIDLGTLPPGAEAALCERLTFANPAWTPGALIEPKYLREYEILDNPGRRYLRAPRGAVDIVRKALASYQREVVWNTRAVVSRSRAYLDPAAVDPELRPYQLVAARALLGRVQGVLQVPTGGGKTRIASCGIVASREPSLVFVHSEDLLAQWVEAFTRLGVTQVRVVQGAESSAAPLADGEIAVCMVQTVAGDLDRYLPLLQSAGAIVTDECFCAGTPVLTRAGIRPIESIRPGDRVKSWAADAAVDGVVGKVFTREVVGCFRLTFDDGSSFDVTPGHPWLTVEGQWETSASLAARLRVSGEASNAVLVRVRGRDPCGRQPGADTTLCSWTSGQEAGTTGPGGRRLHNVRPPGTGPDEAPARSGETCRSPILLGGLRPSVHGEDQFRDDGPHEPEICFRQNDRTKSDAPGGDAGKGERDAQGDRAQAKDTRRQRSGDDQAAASALRGARCGLDSGVCNSHAHESCEYVRVPRPLQNRPCATGRQASSRGRRWQPCDNSAPTTGLQEGGIPIQYRLDCPPVSESRRLIRAEYLPGRHTVYNFSVSPGETYLVGAAGFIVHNCHHQPAASYRRILGVCPARLRWGCTATPDRDDGLGFLLPVLIGPTVFQISTKDLIRLGFLRAPRIVPVDSGWEPGAEHFYAQATCPQCLRVQRTTVKKMRDGTAFCRFKARGGMACGGMLREAESEIERLNYTDAQTDSVDDPGVRALVCGLAEAAVDAGRSVLVLLPRADAVAPVSGELRRRGVASVGVTSATSKKARKVAIDLVRSGHYRVIVATTLADEGLDIPALDFGINVMGGKTKTGVVQRTGRLLRLDGQDPIMVEIVHGGAYLRQWDLRMSSYIKEYGAKAIASVLPVCHADVVKMLKADAA